MKTLLKTKLFMCMLVVNGSLILAQVGINTPNPQAPFHVDGAKDNSQTGTPTIIQQNNDFVVTSTGNVGLGTTTPGTKLTIENGNNNGAIKIADGTQGAGKVLTSDANGVGTWSLAGVGSYVGSWDTSYANKTLSATLAYNGLSIPNIPPGRYYVVISLGTAIGNNVGSGRYANYGFSTTATAGATHFLGNLPNLGPGRWLVENTSWIINITTTSSLYFFQSDGGGASTVGCCSDQFSAIALKLN